MREVAGIPVITFDGMPLDVVALVALPACPECGETLEDGDTATVTPTWPGRLIHTECA